MAEGFFELGKFINPRTGGEEILLLGELFTLARKKE